MEKKNQAAGKTAKKFSGVMLALKIEDAGILRDLINEKISEIETKRCPLTPAGECIKKISKRIQKQLDKRAIEETGDGLITEREFDLLSTQEPQTALQEGGNQTEPEVENEKNDI